MMNLLATFPWFEMLGTFVFALSGAIVAAHLRQTFVTVCFFAFLTGVGGGSVRDVMLGQEAFWIADPYAGPVVLIAALLAWFSPVRWWEGRLLEWADAIGLAAFAALGTAKALSFGVAPISAIVLGIVSGCVGGIIRDVVAGVPSILMRPELYVTAAALSALTATVLLMLDMPRAPALAIATVLGIALRGAALVWRIELPAYSRHGSDPDHPTSA